MDNILSYCDMKRLSETHDTTQLLINRINHPSPQMHELFADALFEIIFKNSPEVIPGNSSTMFCKEDKK